MTVQRITKLSFTGAVLATIGIRNTNAGALRKELQWEESNFDENRRELWAINRNAQLDPTDCTAQELSAIVHTRDGEAGREFISRWADYNNHMRHRAKYTFEHKSYVDLDSSKLFVRMGGNEEATFVYWGNIGWEFKMSAYTKSNVLKESFGEGGRWHFIDPATQKMNRIQKTTVLDDGAHYVVMASIFFEQYQHILIDHLTFLALLRKKLPHNTKFIVPDWDAGEKGHHIEHLLNVIDPQFAKERVVFMECASRGHCNQKVQVTNGGWLSVFKPPTSSRDPLLYSYLREWILTSYTPRPSKYQENGTVIFYTRNTGGVNRRIMDREQEKKLLDHVKHFMHRYDRPEKLVIFDGKLSVQEQIDLFFSASVVIGPHGGGLANLLFTRPGATCADRPKVLEFVTTRATSELQGGGSQFTYYYFFGSMPWVELHNVFYTKVDEGEITYINEGSFYDALYAIFSPEPTPGRSGLRAIAFEQK